MVKSNPFFKNTMYKLLLWIANLKPGSTNQSTFDDFFFQLLKNLKDIWFYEAHSNYVCEKKNSNLISCAYRSINNHLCNQLIVLSKQNLFGVFFF